MRTSSRFVLIVLALGATVVGTPAAVSASTSEVPCEQWYVDADHDSLWNNCDPDGRRERVVVVDTSGGASPFCVRPGVTTLAYGEVCTGNIRGVYWEGYC